MSRERPEPRCEGRAWLFTSTAKSDHLQARELCLGRGGEGPCPMFTTCRATVRDIQMGPHQSGLTGTWAGKLYGKRSAKASA